MFGNIFDVCSKKDEDLTNLGSLINDSASASVVFLGSVDFKKVQTILSNQIISKLNLNCTEPPAFTELLSCSYCSRKSLQKQKSYSFQKNYWRN